jgi:hypothetical protein
MSSRKRKNNAIHHEERRNFRPRVEEPEVVGSFVGYHDPLARESSSGRPTDMLSVQAYEADVIRGPQAWDRARALEVVTNDYGQAIPGESLTKLGDEDARIWVDRYVQCCMFKIRWYYVNIRIPIIYTIYVTHCAIYFDAW